MIRVKNLEFIFMSTLLIYLMIKEFQALYYSKLNAFILHCGLYISHITIMFQYI